jgi:PAS domain S-box-containing protein
MGATMRQDFFTGIDQKSLVSIFEAMDDGIMIVRADYTVDYMNNAMVRIFGTGVGQKCFQVIDQRQSVCPWCRAGEVFEGATVRSRPPSRYSNRLFELLKVPILNSDGTVASMIVMYRDITEKQEYEQRYKTSEQDYRRLFENVRCGVYISSKEGKFVDANQALIDMLGYESKQTLLSIDITADLYLKSEDRRRFQEMIESKGQVNDYEVTFKRADGIPIPVSLTSQVRYDAEGSVLGYEGIIVDLSRRKMIETKLKEALAFLENIIQSSPNGIMVTDMNGSIMVCNKAMEEILGYSKDEIRRLNIRDIYEEGMAKRMMEMMRSPDHGGVGRLNSFPMTNVRRDGTIVEGHLSAAIVYDSKGHEIASVGIFVDLRERLAMERKLRETQEQLFRSEKLASIGRLAAGVAHELNNPVAGIMLCGQLVMEQLSQGSPAISNQQRVLDQAQRCKKIVEGLLDFARQREPETKPLDLNDIIESTFSLIGNQSAFHNIEIVKELDPCLPPILGDRSQLQQVFVNLAINAAEAMGTGGRLSVVSSFDAQFVRVAFTDTGCGIAAEHADKIFEPFFTTKADLKGTGLGLAVSHGIIKKHGGTLSFQSNVGSGTTFTVQLPQAPEHLNSAGFLSGEKQ